MTSRPGIDLMLLDGLDKCAYIGSDGWRDGATRGLVRSLVGDYKLLLDERNEAVRLLDEFDRYATGTEYEESPFQGEVRAFLLKLREAPPCPLEPHDRGLFYNTDKDVMQCPICGHEQHEEMGG